jgi:tRNA (guanosine-2'-O-)-methyltransferase
MQYSREEKKLLTEHLLGFISDNRKNRFDDVIGQRTGHLRVVIENVFQGHNASAVVRSCDCFGVQHVHFIENHNNLRINDDIALGSFAWLSIHRHRGGNQNTVTAISEIRKLGYRIVAAAPDAKKNIADLNIQKPIALVFGTEAEGLSSNATESADEIVTIPMQGFTESFNVSVSAAICMYELTSRIRRSDLAWQLGDEEREEVYFQWLMNSIECSEEIARRFLSDHK